MNRCRGTTQGAKEKRELNLVGKKGRQGTEARYTCKGTTRYAKYANLKQNKPRGKVIVTGRKKWGAGQVVETTDQNREIIETKLKQEESSFIILSKENKGESIVILSKAKQGRSNCSR